MTDITNWVSGAFTTLSSGVSDLVSNIDMDTVSAAGGLMDAYAGYKEVSAQDERAAAYQDYAQELGASAEEQARYQEEKGIDEYAAATRQAQEELRRGRALVSEAKASMAGSGGTTTSSSSVKKFGEIQDTTEYNVLSAMYEGNVRRKDYQNQAEMTRRKGRLGMAEALNQSKVYSAGAKSTALKNIVGGFGEFSDWAKKRKASKVSPWRDPDTGRVYRYD